MVPLFGGRYWTVLSTVILIVPCIWLGVAIQNITTPFWVFIIIALLCGFAGANFASSMGNISFFFPKAKQGSALGVNGGLGNLGVSVMQMVAPAVIFLPLFTFLGVHGVTQPDGSTITLSNAALVWVPLLLLATVAAWFGMNDIARFKGLDSRSASRAQATAYVAVKPALSGDVWLVHRLFRRLCHAGENPVSHGRYPQARLLWTVHRRAGALVRRDHLRPSRRRAGDAG